LKRERELWWGIYRRRSSRGRSSGGSTSSRV